MNATAKSLFSLFFPPFPLFPRPHGQRRVPLVPRINARFIPRTPWTISHLHFCRIAINHVRVPSDLPAAVHSGNPYRPLSRDHGGFRRNVGENWTDGFRWQNTTEYNASSLSNSIWLKKKKMLYSAYISAFSPLLPVASNFFSKFFWLIQSDEETHFSSVKTVKEETMEILLVISMGVFKFIREIACIVVV